MARREVHGFQWKLRRRVDVLNDYFVKGTDKTYPKMSEAIAQVQRAAEVELSNRRRPCRPTALTRKRSRTDDLTPSGRPSRKYEEKARRLKKENEKLKGELSSLTAVGKKKGTAVNGISLEWIVKVFLTAPGQNSRGLAKAFRDIVAVDKNPVSRPTIEKVRGVWVECYKKMVRKVAADRVTDVLAAARVDGSDFVAVFGLHVFDEADLRLRSGNASTQGTVGLIGRSRASKVQQHIFHLATTRGSMEIPTEMEAFGDKTAKTLCTSLERLLRSIAVDVLPATHTKPQALRITGMPQADIWFFHMLVGDGIETNEKAAKYLWTCLQQEGLGPRVRYFLLVIVCGTHQMGLTAKSAVTGRAAACATGGELHDDIAGVTVRLFKYLIKDYFEEFVASVDEWVSRDLKLVRHDAADLAGQASTAKMRNLYGDHVFPDSFLALWNNGCHHMSHVMPAGRDPVAERARVVKAMVQWLVKHLLLVDGSPTLTRFFSFRICTDAMLMMLLLGMPPQALKCRNHREENQQRLVNVLGFFSKPENSQLLRRVSIIFQMTGGVEALVSRLPAEDCTVATPPPVVRICRGEADTIVQVRLQRIIGCIAASDDPDLDVMPATGVMLATAMELIVRLRKFRGYPAALCKMSKKYFWAVCPTHTTSIHAFLNMDPAELDVGTGLQLFELALGVWKRSCSRKLVATPTRPGDAREPGRNNDCQLLVRGAAAR